MATNFARLHPDVAEESLVEVRRAVSRSNGPALTASIADSLGCDFALAVRFNLH